MKRDTDTFVTALRDSYHPHEPRAFTLEPGDHTAIVEIEKSVRAARVLRAWLEGDAYARAAFKQEWNKHHQKDAEGSP